MAEAAAEPPWAANLEQDMIAFTAAYAQLELPTCRGPIPITPISLSVDEFVFATAADIAPWLPSYLVLLTDPGTRLPSPVGQCVAVTVVRAGVPSVHGSTPAQDVARGTEFRWAGGPAAARAGPPDGLPLRMDLSCPCAPTGRTLTRSELDAALMGAFFVVPWARYSTEAYQSEESRLRSVPGPSAEREPVPIFGISSSAEPFRAQFLPGRGVSGDSSLRPRGRTETRPSVSPCAEESPIPKRFADLHGLMMEKIAALRTQRSHRDGQPAALESSDSRVQPVVASAPTLFQGGRASITGGAPRAVPVCPNPSIAPTQGPPPIALVPFAAKARPPRRVSFAPMTRASAMHSADTGLAHACDLIPLERWAAADDVIARLLVTGGRVSLYQGRFTFAWPISFLPEPEWSRYRAIRGGPEGKGKNRSFPVIATLADPQWVAALMELPSDPALHAENRQQPASQAGGTNADDGIDDNA